VCVCVCVYVCVRRLLCTRTCACTRTSRCLRFVRVKMKVGGRGRVRAPLHCSLYLLPAVCCLLPAVCCLLSLPLAALANVLLSTSLVPGCDVKIGTRLKAGSARFDRNSKTASRSKREETTGERQGEWECKKLEALRLQELEALRGADGSYGMKVSAENQTPLRRR
jgi:hypothetical protein